MEEITTTEPKKNAFVFIDGNNFYHNLKDMKIQPSYVDFYKISELVCSHFNCNHKKSIYYNSVPSIADGKKMYYDHMKFLDGIKKLPRFEVKTRKLQRSSTVEIQKEKQEIIDSLELCEKCRPLVETTCSDCVGSIKKREKGIDVMIAVDMLDLSVVQDKCDCCILISGDADFVPVSDIIKDKGKEVFSASLRVGYSFELRSKLKFFILNKNLIMDNCLKEE